MQLELTDIDPSTSLEQSKNQDKPVIAGYTPDDGESAAKQATLNEYILDNWDEIDIHPVMDSPDSPRDLLAAIENNAADIDHVVVAHITDISPSWRDVRDVVKRLTEEGVTVHAVSDAITIDAGTDAYRLLDVVAATEANQAAARELRPGELDNAPHTGRPPAGFEVDESGRLVPGDNYDRVRAAFLAADREQLSKRQAADKAGCTRRTVTRAIKQRRDLYNLDDPCTPAK